MRNANFESKNSPPPQWKPLRVLGILFCLIVFTAGLAGAAAGAEGIVIDSNTDNVNEDKWSYDNSTKTLTLKGGEWDNITAIGIDDFTIVLATGENKITGGYTSGNNIYGIYVHEGTLTIESDGTSAGSLNVTVSGSGSGNVSGIYAKKSIHPESIKIESGKVEVNVTGYAAYGIYADSGILNISGGEVNTNATGTNKAWGIYASSQYASSQYSNNPSYYEDRDVILIAGSTVTAKASAPNATGISITGYGQIKIKSDGIVTSEAIGSDSAKGIFAEDGNIANNAGTVTARATITSDSPDHFAYGLFASGSSPFGKIQIDKFSQGTTAVGSTQAVKANSLGGSDLSIQASTDFSGSGRSSVTASEFTNSLNSYKYVEITIEGSSNVPPNPGSPGNSHSSSSGSAGDGRYFSFPRTTDNGGSVTFGKSPVVTEIILPQGSKGSVVLAVESVEDWPGIEQTPYAFEIAVPEKADGVSEILFRVELSELERLEAQPEGIGIFVKKGDEWMPLLSVFELGEKYVYYTVETDTLGEFEIRFEEGGAVSGETEEPVEPETPTDPVIPDEPQEVLPPIEPPVKDEEPKSPMPILAVLAGLSAAAALRRK